jgi:hypothetical protein
MSDEKTTQSTEEAAQAADNAAEAAANSGDNATSQIMSELSQLSHKVAGAVQSIWESEERYKAEEEIRRTLKLAGERIDRVADDVRKSDLGQDMQAQASRASEAVQKNDVTKQIKQGFLSGLRRFNEELGDFLDKNKADDAAKSAGEAAAEAGKAAAANAEAAARAAEAVVQEAAEKAQTL